VLCAAYQNAVREQKLAAEISAAKRERDFYMGQVDKAKGIAAMKERKRKVCLSCPSSALHQSVQYNPLKSAFLLLKRDCVRFKL